jgi:hypothetical protein
MRRAHMAEFRQRSEAVEAIEVNEAIRLASKDPAKLPTWVRDAWDAGKLIFLFDSVVIRTWKVPMRGASGDRLIPGVDGAIYVRKPDIIA